MGTETTIKGYDMLKKMFSIADYSDTHQIIKILGIKIKFPKRAVAKKLKALPYYNYKKNNTDITCIPPAEGQFRDIQLANLELLKELDYVCKTNRLQYWLDFGTLLGAVRHKGFVPWDDDIDVGMPRNDYNQIIETFNSKTRNPDYYAEYCTFNNLQVIIKLQNKKCPHLFVDIFPYDKTGLELTHQEQLEKTLNIKNLRKDIIFNLKKTKKQLTPTEIIGIYQSHFLNKHRENINGDWVWGADYNHHWKNWFTSEQTIYPLKEIIFEDTSFPCFNNIDGYLKKVYGNYMEYPKKFGYGHNMFADFSDTEKTYIKNLITNKEIL